MVVVACVVAATALLWAGLIWSAFRGKAYEVPLTEVSKVCRMAFPPGAVLVHSQMQVPMMPPSEWGLFAVVAVPRAEVDRLLKGLPGEHELSRTSRESIEDLPESSFTRPPAWWAPPAGGRFVAGRVHGTRFLIALDDPHTATVYVTAATVYH